LPSQSKYTPATKAGIKNNSKTNKIGKVQTPKTMVKNPIKVISAETTKSMLDIFILKTPLSCEITRPKTLFKRP
jgi:hypothetical protein